MKDKAVSREDKMKGVAVLRSMALENDIYWTTRPRDTVNTPQEIYKKLTKKIDTLSYPMLITGAAGGLGRSLAAEAVRRGWSLVLTDRPGTQLEQLAKSLERSYGIKAHTLFCDLTDAQARAELFRQVRTLTPYLSGVVNVAGLDFEGMFNELEPEEIQTLIRVNIEATLDVTHRSLELRKRKKRFLLITVSSLAAFYPMPIKATYAASKRFLLDFFRALKEELRGENVSVTVLCPAGLPTTPGAIRGMELQGFWGHVTAVQTGTVAAGTFDHALQGKFLHVPGVLNKLLRIASSVVPPSLLARYVAWRWRGNTRGALSVKKTVMQ
jgi:uncharacterized protein